MRKITSIFNRTREPELGCGFLSRREVDALVEGRLKRDRFDRFQTHQQTGCTPCVHLAAAVDEFRNVMEHGVLETERAQFERTRRPVKARLRQEVENAMAPDRSPIRGLSADELEQIAAAGEPHDLDRGVEDQGKVSTEPGAGGGVRDPKKDILDPKLGD